MPPPLPPPGRRSGVPGCLTVGALGGVGLLGLLTDGVVLLVTAAVLAAAVVSRRLGAGWGSGMLLGVAAVTAVVARLNRGGPAEGCATLTPDPWCGEIWDPRPWWVATVVLAVLAVLLAVVRPPCRRAHRVTAEGARP